MHDDTGEEHLVERLRSLSEHPVDGAVAERVLNQARPRRAWLRSTRLKVAAAFAGGFLVGGVGLASAGTLPTAAQDVAHDALSAVGINVPPGHDRYNGPECGGTYKNHGQYVRAQKGDPNAGQSPCGKPMKSVDKTTSPDGTDDSDTSGDAERRGPPPWAGKGKDKPDKAEGEPDDATEDDGAAQTTESTTTTLATTTTEAPTAATTTTTEVTTTTSTTAP